nr:Mov34/MPN/PAD-1 family protein [uncultured Chryseobacterium sp.]
MNSRYTLKSKNLSISISNELLEKMYLAVKSHYPNEFGGLLIGYYNNDNENLMISDIILPNIFKSTPVFFERQTEDLHEKLDEFYKNDPSMFYVGEWHSHPNGGTQPSQRDIKAMIQIHENSKVAIEKPILGIMSFNNKSDNYKIQFHLITKNNIYTYEKN